MFIYRTLCKAANQKVQFYSKMINTLFLVCHYNDFYSDTFSLHSDLKSRFTLNGGNYFIQYCLFVNFNSQQYGGCIYVGTSSGSTFVIEDCSFVSCSSIAYGGAIYVAGKQISTQRICASECSSGTYFFSYIESQASFPSFDIMTSIQLSKCPSGNYMSKWTNGDQKHESSNVSYCISNYCAVWTEGVSKSKFCTYTGFHGSAWIGVFFYMAVSSLSYSNLVNNTQVSSTWGFVYSSIDTELSECILIDNSVWVFQSVGGTLSVINSYIQVSYTKSGAVNIISPKTVLVMNKLNHLNSYLCLGNNIDKMTNSILAFKASRIIVLPIFMALNL